MPERPNASSRRRPPAAASRAVTARAPATRVTAARVANAPAGPAAARRAALRPLGGRELDELQALLDRVPAPLEPLDVSMLDGFLCGVLVQPQRLPLGRWLPHVTDVEGRPLPPGFDARRLHGLV